MDMLATVGSLIRHSPPRELICVAASAQVAEAVEVMTRADIGAVIVMTEDGLVGGIFTERDLMVRVARTGLALATTPVSKVMSPDVRFVAPSTTIRAALDLMLRDRHRHLLVIDGPHVHGLVSMRDLVLQLVRDSETGPVAEAASAGSDTRPRADAQP